jgi:hypothetical protein
MRLSDQICIFTTPDDIPQGLFGGVFLFAFEILPYLQSIKTRPRWSITSKLYGSEPDFEVIPGLLDLGYEAPEDVEASVNLLELKQDRPFALGNDWHKLNRLWSEYFRVPNRIEQAVRRLGPLDETLGIHYRGRDKITTAWDSNPVSFEDFAVIITDLLQRKPSLKRIFLATDETAFDTYLRSNLEIPIIGHGAGRHHLEQKTQEDRTIEADRALIDCLALSRCAAVLNTSSALSAFSKVLNPDLEIYRCAASKMFADIPYFPIAYIPQYKSNHAAVVEVLTRTMAGDWLSNPGAWRFRNKFAFKSRAPFRAFLRRMRKRLRNLPLGLPGALSKPATNR